MGGNYWCSTANETNSCIGYEYDDKSLVKIAAFLNGSTSNTPNERCQKIKLQCSQDNSTWIDASDIITLSNEYKTNYIYNTKVSDKHKYWRILVISIYGMYASSDKVQFYSYDPNITIDKNLENHYTNSELASIVNSKNMTLQLSDINFENYLNKISFNSNMLNLLFHNTDFINYITTSSYLDTFINILGLRLVPYKSDNSNILYSSYYSSSYAPYMLFDNNLGNYWCSTSANASNAFIGYNFETPRIVSFARIQNGSVSDERCKNVILQYSDNGSEWFDASDEITLPNDSSITLIRSNILTSHSYWRIYIKTVYGTYSAAYLLQFYGL